MHAQALYGIRTVIFRMFRMAVKAERKEEDNHSNGHGDKDETSSSFFYTHIHACIHTIYSLICMQLCCLFRRKQNHSSDDDHGDVVDDDFAIRTYTNLRDVCRSTHGE